MKEPDFNLSAAHKYFSSHCFQGAWDLMEKKSRTEDEDLMMVALNQASLYHWHQRRDCEPKRLSVAYWQSSRIQALLGNGEKALEYADVCLSHSLELEPFYLGYAYEALSRGEFLLGHPEKGEQFRESGVEQAELVENPEEKDILLMDLDTVYQK